MRGPPAVRVGLAGGFPPVGVLGRSSPKARRGLYLHVPDNAIAVSVGNTIPARAITLPSHQRVASSQPRVGPIQTLKNSLFAATSVYTTKFSPNRSSGRTTQVDLRRSPPYA